QMGPQRHRYSQSEVVQLKVNGTVLQIDGLGIDAADNKTVIHTAFGIITYDVEQKEYTMRAFRGDGARIDASLRPVDAETIVWGFTHPLGGDMKYTITIRNNEWIEVGEMSRDGNTWFKFLEMTLHKQ
ncbi:MAG TPA: hypothetical protein VK907_08125, partial [Phnomibacter sp.]|nr:hypothetical protein [Phnomibacter sp.]